MANAEHLDILRRGVEKWNQWRARNSQIEPDLSWANFSNKKLIAANFSGANFNGADLNLADLFGANFSNANLSEAKFKGANLRRTNLIEVNLFRAYLRDAHLHGARLIAANLSEADLTKANLSRANLKWANLNRANLNKANLFDVNLHEAYLIKADLSETNLSQANLSRTDLSEANLSGANLKKANLQEANLSLTRLLYARLEQSTLTGARLWETQRAGWAIKRIICKSICWDERGETLTPYATGEFERLYAEKTKVRLFYPEGITQLEIATLPGLIEHLKKSHPGCGLRLVSITEDAGGAVVELAIENTDKQTPDQLQHLKVEIETTAQRAVEIERKFLAEERQRLQLEGEVKQLTSFVDKLILRPNFHIQGNYMGDTFNVSGQAGAVGPNAHAHDMTFNQIANQLEKSVDLSELAKQLTELRQAITAKQDASPQAAIAVGEVAKAEIAAQAKESSKVVEYLKSAGQWALDFAKETGKDIAAEAIKKSMGLS